MLSTLRIALIYLLGKRVKGVAHVVQPPNGVMGKGSVLKHRGGG